MQLVDLGLELRGLVLEGCAKDHLGLATLDWYGEGDEDDVPLRRNVTQAESIRSYSTSIPVADELVAVRALESCGWRRLEAGFRRGRRC